MKQAGLRNHPFSVPAKPSPVQDFPPNRKAELQQKKRKSKA